MSLQASPQAVVTASPAAAERISTTILTASPVAAEQISAVILTASPAAAEQISATILTASPAATEQTSDVKDDPRDVDSVPLPELWAEDFRTHDRLWLEPGFWAVAVHRLGSRSQQVKSSLLRRPLVLAHHILSAGVDWTWGIRLPLSTRVGRRLRIWHHGSILLNARSIGDDVHVRHDTTIGPLRYCDSNRPECLPVIEDGVDIASGACVQGPVHVGRGAFVGANSVVVQEVPPGATVLGVPARIIPK